ncbi:MAG: hypothetical protein MZW92_48365 [Comamonadaceae bacterium]|nr:hypothetical protein [Comamonadaceae bacterium]
MRVRPLAQPRPRSGGIGQRPRGGGADPRSPAMTVLLGEPRRHVAVVMHDVAASRWAGCTRVLALARATARPRRRAAAGDAARRAGDARRAGAAELHPLAAAPGAGRPRTGAARLAPPRRGAAAGGRSSIGCAVTGTPPARASSRRWRASRPPSACTPGWPGPTVTGLPMAGFVAPAWLMSRGSWEAVADGPFAYTCTLDRIVALPGGQALRARSLVFSTRSAWRVHASVLWNGTLGRLQRLESAAALRAAPERLRRRRRPPVLVLDARARAARPRSASTGEAAGIARRLGTPPAGPAAR